MKAGGRIATDMSEGYFDIPAGERLGEWRIVRPIGAGRYGRVYEATYEPPWWWRRKRDVPARAALKVFEASLLLSPVAQAALSDEAEAMRSINHPNVLRFYNDITLPRGSKYPGTRFFVLELGECDLQEEANRTGVGLEPEQVKEIARNILLGLGAVHHRLVHGDIKPENVIKVGGSHKLADMGVAARLEGTGAYPRTGTMRYRPPEYGTQTGTHPSTKGKVRVRLPYDIWCLGVTLHEALTLRHPYETPGRRLDGDAIFTAVRSGEGRWIDVDDPTLHMVIERCLDPDEATRADVDELLGILDWNEDLDLVVTEDDEESYEASDGWPAEGQSADIFSLPHWTELPDEGSVVERSEPEDEQDGDRQDGDRQEDAGGLNLEALREILSRYGAEPVVADAKNQPEVEDGEAYDEVSNGEPTYVEPPSPAPLLPSAPPPPVVPHDSPKMSQPRRRSRRARLSVLWLVVVLFLLAGSLALVRELSAGYYVAAPDGGTVGIYDGPLSGWAWFNGREVERTATEFSSLPQSEASRRLRKGIRTGATLESARTYVASFPDALLPPPEGATSGGPITTTAAPTTSPVTTSPTTTIPPRPALAAKIDVKGWARCTCFDDFYQIKVYLDVTNTGTSPLEIGAHNGSPWRLLVGPPNRGPFTSLPKVPSPIGPYGTLTTESGTLVAVPPNPPGATYYTPAIDFATVNWPSPMTLAPGENYTVEPIAINRGGVIVHRGSTLVFNLPTDPSLTVVGIALVVDGKVVGMNSALSSWPRAATNDI